MNDDPLRLLCILAHPDDETLGTGGTLVHYARQGVETHVLTATHGQSGRYHDTRPGDDGHPGREELAEIRERELRAAAEILGVDEVSFLGYVDGELDEADPEEATRRIAAHIRRIRPQVVVTFDGFGAYGHPDHIAISQLAGAGCMAAADPEHSARGEPHAVSKLYWMAWTAAPWEAYQAAFKKLVSTVDGVEREASPWPDWAVTADLDTSEHWRTVWRAVRCHDSQTAVYGKLAELDEEYHRVLWGTQQFYRVFSTVNGGRTCETDLFEGLR